MAKSIQEWISEGEELHTAAVAELQELENQIADLEQKRSAKLAEVSQIAGIIGKQAPESARRMTTAVVEDHPVPGVAVHASSATIARALAGKGLGR
jgi:hypothetical protein